jgi:hypothetical protein
VEATSRQIAAAAAAAEKQWTKAGSELIHKPAQPAAPAAGQKRRRPQEAAAAAPTEPLTPEQEEAEADDLIARIMSGALWPIYRG